MDLQAVIDILLASVPESAAAPGAATDQPTLYVGRDALVATCRVLRDHPALRFSFLADVTAVDCLPREPRFELVYHLVCLGPWDAGVSGRITDLGEVRILRPASNSEQQRGQGHKQ